MLDRERALDLLYKMVDDCNTRIEHRKEYAKTLILPDEIFQELSQARMIEGQIVGARWAFHMIYDMETV